MSDYPPFEPNEWESLIYSPEFAPRPGFSIGEALDRLSLWEGASDFRPAAISYLQSGLWTASCRRARYRQGILKMSDSGGFEAQLRRLENGWCKYSAQSTHGPSQISQSVWHKEHGISAGEWVWGTGFLWPDGARVDLERGIVESFCGFVHPDSDEAEFLGVHLSLYGVEIDESDVEATAPPKAKPAAPQPRSNTYDWEAAFADVAAKLYHDVQFPDLNARGVQAEIIDLLRASFEERRLPVPSDETFKPKARKLLGSLRAKIPE